MLCLTPLIGNLSERKTAHYENFQKALEKARDTEFIEFQLLHQPAIQLEAFYNNFLSNEEYSKDDVNNALQDSIKFLNKMHDQNKAFKRYFDQDPQFIRHLFQHISYRLILTEDRAIFFTPLYLPQKDQTSDLSRDNKNKKRAIKKVEMVGFETEDYYLISELRSNFDFLMEKTDVTGTEQLKYIRKSNGKKIRLSSIEPMLQIKTKENDNEKTERVVLWVHGNTGSLYDKRWKDRLNFRDKLSRNGFSSYEFNYFGRGKEVIPESIKKFSLHTASEDLKAVIRYILRQHDSIELNIVGRGMGMYVALLSEEVKSLNCRLIFWQPIPYPKRTMEARGHFSAFYNSYLNSDGHDYIEISGIRLYQPFFDYLQTIKPPEELVWDGINMDLLCTEGDKVTKLEWIKEFIQNINTCDNMNVNCHVLDTESDKKDHLHEDLTEMTLFIDRTLEILK